METWYDMHCHLGFAPDPAATARAGAHVGIGAFSCTVSPEEYERIAPLMADGATVAVGLGAHPWQIADGSVDGGALARFCELAAATAFIGEVGLDFAGPRDGNESRTVQTAALQRILAACDDGAPKLISLHAVNAAGTVLDLLEAAGTARRHCCIFHWFSGTSDDLTRALDDGCYISVGPRMLVSRRGREYARQIPLDHLLLETDMPSRAGETLPANVWQAELGNALSGIAQLKAIDRTLLAERLATTSAALLGTEQAPLPRARNFRL